MNRIFSGFSCLFILLISGVATAEVRTFTDREGRTIRATLESADATTVDVRMENGRYFTIPREKLSDKDNEFIDIWIYGEMLENERLFLITGRRKDGNDSKSDSTGIITETRDGWYDITIENRTGVDLEGLEIRYLVRLETTSAGSAGGDRKTEKWEKGSIEDFKIADRAEDSLSTKKVSLSETRLKPGWRWTSGAPPTARDKLTGLYLAVLVKGEVFREYALPSGLLEDGRNQMFPRSGAAIGLSD